MTNIKIREGSLLARCAAWKMRSHNVAIVFGKTVHLWGASRHDFLQHQSWVQHELQHVRQFQQHGFLKFIFLYLMESLRHGYYNNRFEKEARAAEGSALAAHEFMWV